MHATRVWARLLGIEQAVIEKVTCEQDGDESLLVVRAHPRRGQQQRCPHCRQRCSRFDGGDGVRRWRAPDVGVVKAFVEAEAPRVTCREHGVVVASVPWPRHRASFTRTFENHLAWLVVRTDKTTVSSLLRVSWRAVGSIVERVSTEQQKLGDRFPNLRRIGIDETSYRKGHRYVTIVVDHDTGRLIWAMPGKDEATLRKFFDELGPERCKEIQLVSADAAPFVKNVVAEMCASATLCLDPFHIVKWATEALDIVRRKMWNDLRRGGRPQLAKSLKNSRYVLWKNPENLSEIQAAKLAEIQRLNKLLHRAYLMKEQLREVFRVKGWLGVAILERWAKWAQRCRLAPFVKLACSIREHSFDIGSALLHGLSNARLEATATKLKVLNRQSFGFHSPQPLIDLAMLKLGGLCPGLAWLS